jgi:hypothetical protein
MLVRLEQDLDSISSKHVHNTDCLFLEYTTLGTRIPRFDSGWNT